MTMNKDIQEIATELNKYIIERVFFEINGLNSCNLDDIGIDFGVKIKYVDFTTDDDKIIGEMKATIFYGSSASEIYEQIDAHTVWCYEQVCLAEMFKLPKMLLANLLIARVSSSTDLNHKCPFVELNLFLFFFKRWQKINLKN